MPLNGYEKAAIFLSALGEEAASEILKNLDVTDIGKITSQMTRMKTISAATVKEIMDEAIDMMGKGDMHVGGEDFVKKILHKGLGAEGAEKILEQAAKESPLDSLKWVEPKTLTTFLVTEHPQTIALIICLLEPMQAAAVLSALPDKIKADVALRVATTERIPENAVTELNEVLKGQLDIGGKGKGKKLVGTRVVAEILNNVDKATEQLVIERIEEQNSVVADAIRALMFIFDDLSKVDDRGIQMILKEISTDDLSLALKTASEALKEKIFKNMSQRAVTILKDDMSTKGPAKVSEVDKAQQNILKVARKLEQEGKIVLAGRGGEELV